MTTPTEIIARALCVAQGYRETENELARTADEAAAIITALKAAGYAIVPVEPTDEMLEAAEHVPPLFTPCDTYSAMIRASGKES
jgi:hypothetical protein